MSVPVLVVTGSIAHLLAGEWMLFWPSAVIRCLQQFGEESCPKQSRWNVRVAGAVLLLFALAGLHLVLVDGLKPFPPGEHGVGF